MAIHPDIRDEAYQFFIQEATELLQAIEMGVLTLSQNRSQATVHELMRAAHSLKGGSASVGLKTISSLAHRLESIFKVFYDESIDITPQLERSLLKAYDCLRLPLKQQIEQGRFDSTKVLEAAEPIFSQLEHQFQDVLMEVENYVPSSGDLGVDMVASIFEIDVTQGLEHLTKVIQNPQAYDVVQELRQKIEVFTEFAELFNIKALRTVTEIAGQALDQHPGKGVPITRMAIKDFEQVREAILSGDRTPVVTLSPEWQLLAQDKEILGLNLFSESHLPMDYQASELDMDIEPDMGVYPDLEEDSLAALDAFLHADDFSETSALDHDNHYQSNAEEHTVHPASPILNIASSVDTDMSGIDVDDDVDTEELSMDDIDLFLTDLNALEEDVSTVEPTGSEKNSASQAIPLKVTKLDSMEGKPQILDAEFEELDIEIQGHDYSRLLDIDTSLENNTVKGDILESKLKIETTGQYKQFIEPEPSLIKVDQQESRVVPFQPTPRANILEVDEQTDALVSRERSPQKSSQSPTSSTKTTRGSSQNAAKPKATIRVDTERLERMNNLVGELAINREGLALQNEQLQNVVQELLKRFSRFQTLVESLRDVSDQMLIAPERYGYKPATNSEANNSRTNGPQEESRISLLSAPSFGMLTEQFSLEFDALEMDQYGMLHAKIQGILEDLVQLEEGVEDIKLFSQQTDQTINNQRYQLTHLRDELVWARMLPLGDILNRYPRILHDLSISHNKPVNLKLTGTGVLVDRGVLEKLYDPLLHLIRNAFDHGIESAALRQERNKTKEGQIEIRAFHQGNQTIIEVTDDGQGINFDSIRKRLFALGWASIEQIQAMTSEHLLEILFVSGFSTARQVSQLSGRGVGLDVVRSQLQTIKGNITITSVPGEGTTFTLYVPLRLTIAKLIICLAGPVALAFPSDSIEEILTPLSNQVNQSANQRFLNWNSQIIPIHSLTDLLDYHCPVPDSVMSKALVTVSTPKDWPSPMLVCRQEQKVFALEVNKLVNEHELVIKPFGQGITPPPYAYGSAILGDGSLVPVLDAAALLRSRKSETAKKDASRNHPSSLSLASSSSDPSNSDLSLAKSPIYRTLQTPTILVVDDAVTIRRSLTLSLTRSGFRILQARNGREALTQLQQSSSVNLIICDIEMPNMNGFEFLTHRRQDPKLSLIPIVMLTSRGNDKHRRLATRLGATGYFTKPYLEHEFLSAIQSLIDQPIVPNVHAT
ncbi:MAG: hybrid sensor histidine kinase/response regulator [Cyanobacteria bacterium P01_F01_bin.150]